MAGIDSAPQSDPPPTTLNGLHKSIAGGTASQHPTYWFDDGSLVIQVQSNAYRIHGSLLDRHSPVISSLARSTSPRYDVPTIYIPDQLGVTTADFEALLEHLYHDTPLDFDTPFSRVASVLRITSEHQLHLQSINNIARHRIQHMFPRSLPDLTHSDEADHALALAVQYNLYPIQKALYYNVATHFHFDDDDDEGAGKTPDTPSDTDFAQLPPEIAQTCKDLLDHLISHFTPVLFTVATAHHMECTDVFAETWMPLVISPALESNGLCKPIETLQAIIDLDWKEQGLCTECVQAKREEWRGEQKEVWDKLDDWLGLGQAL